MADGVGAPSSQFMDPDGGDRESDERLLARFRNATDPSDGRRAAGRLLSRYRGRVYVWCYRYVRDHDRALDLAQDVLLKAWLFSIARNECLTALRPRSWRRDPDVDPLELLVQSDDPPALLVTREEEEAMEALVRDHLSPVEQEAIWLRCFEGLPVPEVTRLLGLTNTSGARSVLQSAREKLRAALKRRR
jgi:RNA polymerase sigma-70 factor (ECF subfamily)